MNCPGCGEVNESGMQFCIFCGVALPVSGAQDSSPSASLASEPAIHISDTLPAASSLRVCLVCKKTDPLNGMFCVHCGGKTEISVPAAAPAPHSANYPEPAAEPKLPRSDSATTAAASLQTAEPAIIPALLLGFFLAALLVFAFKKSIVEDSLHRLWPRDRTLLYTSMGAADFEIYGGGKKTLLFGQTSSDGTALIPVLSADSYRLTLRDKAGKEFSSSFTLNGSEHTVGYPERIGPK